MGAVNFIMQGKGGVGKSFVASVLFQYLKHRNLSVKGFDTDPVNKTFAKFKEFEVTQVDIMEGNDINRYMFDRLISLLSELPEETHAVVDNGASSFVSFCAYVKDEKAFDILQEVGKEVVIHVPVTGGQALPETITTMNSLLMHFAEYPLVAWLNPKDGPIGMDNHDFYEFTVYKEHRDQFRAVIEMPAYRKETYERDLAEHLTRCCSFDYGKKYHGTIVTKSRIHKIQKDLYEIIDRAGLI
jgi:hypothetical protein